MNKYRQRNRLIKHLEILLIKINLALKENKEYKINLWNAFIINIIYVLVMSIFYISINPLLEGIISWSNQDFLLFLLLHLFMGKFLIIFSIKGLRFFLLSGEFNVILNKPINTFFHISTQFSGPVFLIFVTLFIITSIAIILEYMKNVFLFLLFFVLSSVYLVIFFSFFNSFAFFIKNDSFMQEIPRKINNRLKEFTPNVFQKTSIYEYLFIFPSVFGSFILVEILKGKTYFFSYLYIVIISFFILSFGTYLLWKYGLKKYEAFG